MAMRIPIPPPGHAHRCLTDYDRRDIRNILREEIEEFFQEKEDNRRTKLLEKVKDAGEWYGTSYAIPDEI